MTEQTAGSTIVVILQAFVCAYGLLAYVVVLVPLCKFRSTTFSKPFFTSCLALAFIDVLNMINRLSKPVVEPSLLHGDLPNWYLLLRNFYERCFFYAVACIQFVMALERTLVVFSRNGKYVLTNVTVLWALFALNALILITNFCVLTPICPVKWYVNTTTVSYDKASPEALFHNRFVDFGLQPLLMAVTVLLYVLSGWKVMSVRRSIRPQPIINANANSQSVKKARLDHVLFLHAFIVSIPHTIVIVVYHLLFYVTNLSATTKFWLDITLQFVVVFGNTLNPVLHLILNKELREKTVEAWCMRSAHQAVLVTKRKYNESKSDTPSLKTQKT